MFKMHSFNRKDKLTRTQIQYQNHTVKLSGDIFNGLGLDVSGEGFEAYQIDENTVRHLPLLKKPDQDIITKIFNPFFIESMEIYLTSYPNSTSALNFNQDYERLLVLFDISENLSTIKSKSLALIRKALPYEFTPFETQMYVPEPFGHSFHNYKITNSKNYSLDLSIVFATPRNVRRFALID